MGGVTFYNGLVRGFSDDSLKLIIERKMPEGILVNVESCDRSFGGMRKKPAKKIILTGTLMSRLSSIIQELFQGISTQKDVETKIYYDNTVVSTYLLDNVEDSASREKIKELAIQQIKQECHGRRMMLNLYFSTDGKSIQFGDTQEAGWCTIL